VTLAGVVVDEPDVRDTYQNLRLRAETLTMESVGAGRAGAPIGPLRGRPAPTQPAPTNRAGVTPAPTPDTRPVTGLVLVQASRYPAHAYGERLVVSGELETPPVFEDFSYKDYLARQGVYSMLRRPRIELIEAGQGNPMWAALYAFKARGQGTIAQILPEPYAALLTGILLGVETGIPQRWYSPQNTIPLCT
jgi:hypothetical protein